MIEKEKFTTRDSKEGVFVDYTNKKNLLVSFGGVNQGFGMPVFEFFNSLKELECDKIFIRDFNQMWYQKGVDKKINSLQKLRYFLKNEIEIRKYERVCFIGNSMGGYAAILLGVLLDIDSVLCFAPQTFIDKRSRILNADFRWKKQINSIYSFVDKKTEYFDLKKVLKSTNYSTKIDIFYSQNHRLDKIHSKRLIDAGGVRLHPSSKGGHNLVKELKKSGDLDKLLKQIFYN